MQDRTGGSKAKNLPRDIAERAFKMVNMFVSKAEKIKSKSHQADSGIGDQMKSAVVFELCIRDFELALQKEPLDAKILVWYGKCVYWKTRFVSDHQEQKKLEELAESLFNRALKGKNVTQAKVYQAWATTLQDEALVRNGWKRTVLLQKALAQVQKCNQLRADSSEGCDPSFIQWHALLNEQQKQLDPSGRTFGTV